MKVKMNDAAVRQMYAGIGKKLEDADLSFRAQHEGEPAEYLIPEVKRWFAQAGFDLKPGQIDEYAKAVSAKESFKWVLQ